MESMPLFKVFMPASVMGPLKKTLFSGYLTHGPRVDEFEKKLSGFIGNKRVLNVCGGTHALQLALRLAGIGPGDEVISSPMTCVATNMPIMMMNARIRWTDVLMDTGNIDPDSIEPLITKKTKAVMYVHWAGSPGKIDEINEIAKNHNLKVIEDAAHAFGAEYKGEKLGNHSDFAIFSFQAIKHLTTGDGGALFCKHDADYKKGKALRWFGLDRSAIREELRWYYDIEEYGYKFNMNDIDATIGLEQLKYIRKNLQIHRRNGEYYNRKLRNIDGIDVLRQEKGAKSVYWVYTLLADNREKLVSNLKKHGIASSIVHTRNDVYTCFSNFKDEIPRPGLDYFTKKYLSIPSGWWVTKKDAESIVEKVREVYE